MKMVIGGKLEDPLSLGRGELASLAFFFFFFSCA